MFVFLYLCFRVSVSLILFLLHVRFSCSVLIFSLLNACDEWASCKNHLYEQIRSKVACTSDLGELAVFTNFVVF